MGEEDEHNGNDGEHVDGPLSGDKEIEGKKEGVEEKSPELEKPESLEPTEPLELTRSEKPGEEEGVKGEEEEELLSFLGETEPEGEENKAKFWLLQGASDEEVAAKGVNSGTVRIARSHLIRDGYMKKEPKPPKDIVKTSTKLTAPSPKDVQVFAKGSPPEALINSMKLPLVDGQMEGFESGLKFGASMVVMGVRIAQELSALGVQNVRPLIELTKEARAGEAAAAKNASYEAAMMAASQVQQNLAPMLANLGKTPAGTDPMKGMLVRTFEPMFQSMMKKIMPGMESGPPSGWSRRSE